MNDVRQLIIEASGIDDHLDQILRSMSDSTDNASQLIMLRNEVSDLYIKLQKLHIDTLNQAITDDKIPKIRETGSSFIEENGPTLTERMYGPDFMSMLAPKVRYYLIKSFKDWYITNKKDFPGFFSSLEDNNGVMPSVDFGTEGDLD